MGRPRQFDTDEALAATMEQFWSNGYEGTSLSDLVAATGLARASLYNAFGSKHDMYLASLDRYYEQRIPEMLAGLESGDEGLAAVTAFFEQFPAAVATMPDRAAQGCLMVNSSTETATVDPAVAARVGVYRQRLRNAFATALERAADRGELESAGPAQADQLLLSAIGLFVTIRGRGSLPEVRQLTDAVIQTVKGWQESC